MRPAPGDIVYAYRKTKAPSRRRFSVRFGLQHPVLRLSPWSHTDEHGDDWISVLPVPYGLMNTRLNPRRVALIPVVDCEAHRDTIPADLLRLIVSVLEGTHPAYAWIDPDDETERPDEAYPTVPEARRR